MKNFLAVAVLMLASCGMSMAWNCTTPGQVRVQVPTGTIGNGVGDGSGQVVVDSGLTFICEKLPVATTTPPSSTSTSSATSTSGAKSSINNSGNSKSTSSVGPITNTNTNKLSNTQKQGQTQSNALTNTNDAVATNNGDNSNNSQTTVEAPKIPVNTAVAPPVFSTANCFKGVSGGMQTAPVGLSFGGGSIDKNCAALMTAQNLYAMGSRLAACKVIIGTKSAKEAGVTMEDCMAVPAPRPVVVAPVVPVIAPPVVAPVVVNVPAPQVLYVPEYHVTTTVTAPVTKWHTGKNVTPKKKKANCIIPPSIQKPMEK